MSTLIIGAGLSGLITAIRLKEADKDIDVCVIEKQYPQGNSYIAGQRIRAGIARRRENSQDEILSLFGQRNGGEVTKSMKEFSQLLISELEKWGNCGLPYQDKKDWFGPQWGIPSLYGVQRAYSVLKWFRLKALSLGVRFLSGEIIAVHKDTDIITHVIMILDDGSQVCLSADAYVLAGGSSTGLLFHSTNRLISNPPQLLAEMIDIKSTGGSVTMLHPFGMCGSDGKRLMGCYETDLLANYKVFDTNNNRLSNIEEMLNCHKAHYHFPAICKQFNIIGGMVRLQSPQGEMTYAGVSIHYNQLGITTVDGVSVKSLTNLFAVGDASGVNYWTNYRERFPGIAIANCIVTGAKCANIIHNQDNHLKSIKTSEYNHRKVNIHIRISPKTIDLIKSINTASVVDLTLNISQDQKYLINKWEKSINTICQDKESQYLKSLCIALIMEFRHKEKLINQ